MLKETLSLINKTNLYSHPHISKELNITEDLAKVLVEDLIRMGYLIEDLSSSACNISCNKCPYARSCNTTLVKTFKISSKGERLLKSM